MAKNAYQGPLEQIDECCWRIPKSYKPGMRVDGLIFASAELIRHIRDDQAAEQVANAAFLPGIQTASLAMPDIHWGYGFCIGGVCATDPSEGLTREHHAGPTLRQSRLATASSKKTRPRFLVTSPWPPKKGTE